MARSVRLSARSEHAICNRELRGRALLRSHKLNGEWKVHASIGLDERDSSQAADPQPHGPNSSPIAGPTTATWREHAFASIAEQRLLTSARLDHNQGDKAVVGRRRWGDDE
jgi:hypothetical protein